MIGFDDLPQETVIGNPRSYTFSRKSSDFNRWPINLHTSICFNDQIDKIVIAILLKLLLNVAEGKQN